MYIERRYGETRVETLIDAAGKAGTDIPSVSYDEALETALCFGWIDGQKKKHDERYWLQRFTPRRRTAPGPGTTGIRLWP
jgi:uncharacterized protein YdeI (YjbR/CyaY-like superfamily)